MSTYVLGAGIPALVAKEIGKVADVTFNFATTPYNSGDIIQLPVPLNALVSDVLYQVLVANTDGGARTIGIGDIANSATHWATAASLTTAGNMTASGQSAELYAANPDAIQITFNESVSSGTLRVVAYAKLI